MDSVSPRADKPRTAFLAFMALAALGYVGLLYAMAPALRIVGILAPMVLALALAIARVWRKHWEYRMAQLMSQPVSGVVGRQHYQAGPHARAGEPFVRPVFVKDTPSHERHHLR